MARDSLAETAKDGRFVRTESVFRDWVRADGTTAYPAEAGRYLLYVSYACPWASRCLAVRAMKGLDAAIDVAVVAPLWKATKPGVDEHRGWAFDAAVAGATADPVWGAATLRDVYEHATNWSPAVVKFTVPVLFDKTTRAIVNNESSEIVRMLNAEFNAFATRPEVDLYPTHLRTAIDAVNDEVYHAINNGVYKAGFATGQAAYEEAVTALFATLDKLDALLSSRRYLTGSTLTEADIRLVMTLVRHDEVYITHFKCGGRRIVDYPHLWPYTCDVVTTAGIEHTINMSHIKSHYYGSHTKLNPFGIVPVGDPKWTAWRTPHGRDKLGAEAAAAGGK